MRFSNPESSKGKWSGEVLTEEEIILNQVQTCIKRGSVEFRGGYWVEKNLDGGLVERYYVSSTVEVFSNSVLMLEILLSSHFQEKGFLDELEKDSSIPEEEGNERNKALVKNAIKKLRLLLKYLKKDNFLREEEAEEIIGEVN